MLVDWPNNSTAIAHAICELSGVSLYADLDSEHRSGPGRSHCLFVVVITVLIFRFSYC